MHGKIASARGGVASYPSPTANSVGAAGSNPELWATMPQGIVAFLSYGTDLARKQLGGITVPRAMRVVLPILLMLLLSCATDALIITGCTTGEPGQVVFVPCPSHVGYNCMTAVRSINVLPLGANPGFEAAWSNFIYGEWDPTGWTFNWSTEGIDATLNVTTYRASCHESGRQDGGAEIQVEWAPSPQQTDLKWVQAVHTNRPRVPYEWYLDILRLSPNRPPLYPYQYADQHFYDAPTRNCEAGQHIFWEACLYLARVDRTNKVATIYEGLTWGFTIDCWAVVEPSGLAALLTGLATLVAGGISKFPCR